MGVKSIVDIQINDGAWKAFQAQYERYNKLLKDAPTRWAEVEKYAKGTKASFADLVAGQIAVQAKQKLIAEATKEAQRQTRSLRDDWNDIAKSTKSVATNLFSATTSILKWTSVTGLFSAILGAGGLFGIDRLASNVSAGRRSSMGLGIGYGQQRSFELNYGRVIDAGTFLSGVNEALHDVTRRSSLYGAGLRENDLQGRGTGDVAAALLPRLKALADATPESQLAQVMRARGLDQFMGLQDFMRLRSTSKAELAEYARGYGRDQGSLGLDAGAQRVWQDFSVQMSRAGSNIETVFVRGLEPLIPALGSLSDSVTKAISTFLSAPKLKEWIQDFGTGLEKVAVYLGSDDFQKKIEAFNRAFGGLVDTVVGAYNRLHPVTSAVSTYQGPPPTSPMGRLSAWWNGGSWTPRGNNPGNLRMPGQSTGFATFATQEDGIRAMARQLLLYQDRDKLNTISGIVSKYAPSSENDTAAYIRNVASRTGFGADQPLDLHNKDTMAALISAMTKQENHRSNYQRETVVKIIDNTGGNVNISTNQVAQ